jgi:hypothetical protein
MIKLNLPQFDIKIQDNDGKSEIFDVIRKKYVLLTPEEWVRQHFLHLLINHYQYPKSLIKIETGLKYNQLQKRSDIVVYDREGKPFLIVECKSTDVPLSQKTFEQITTYNYTLKSKYVVLTNGLHHFCCSIDHEKGAYEFMKDLPPYGEIPKNKLPSKEDK